MKRSTFPCLLVLACLAACEGPTADAPPPATPGSPPPSPADAPPPGPTAAATVVPPEPTVAPTGKKPNIVFVLTDDLATNLVQYMPNVLAMQRDGVSFSNYIVSNSFCCPSRSSIFTGKYPHNTGVLVNAGPRGGMGAFNSNGNDRSNFALSLQAGGYKTAMLGKYLNGYLPKMPQPAGWTEWYVAGMGYNNFNYNLRVNNELKHFGNAPEDYLTDVISGFGQGFIKREYPTGPFFIELATFTPHKPYVPAPRDANGFADLHAPRTRAFGIEPRANAPGWMREIKRLDPQKIEGIERDFRRRVQSVQAVDKMIGDVRAELAALHDENTYVIFSSDNGYHMGEWNLHPGKLTAYDTDVRVPLVVVGPGLPKGKTVDELVQNTDLCPTFIDLAGAPLAPSAPDGRSIVPLLHEQAPADWRQVTLIEHDRLNFNPQEDPDSQTRDMANPPPYYALRTHQALYVEYADGDTEFHDLTKDPDEIDNTVASLPADRKARLHAAIEALKTCKGEEACKAAERVAP